MEGGGGKGGGGGGGGGGAVDIFLDGLWYLGENLFLWVVVLWENILAWVVVFSVNNE